MTIYGLDNNETLESTDPVCQIIVNKGEPQTGWGSSTRPGIDLKDRFRLDIGDKILRDRLLRIYRRRGDFIEEKCHNVEFEDSYGRKKKKTKQFLYVKHLNVHLAYEDWQKSFYTEMRKQKGRITEWRCNRRVIFEESEMYSDWVGHMRSRMVSCDRPCEAPENVHEDCKHGCRKNGDLYFYLWEFDDCGFALCKINTHAYCDFITIPRDLKTIAELYGNVRRSPIDAGRFKLNIPYTITRKEVPISRPVTEKKRGADGKIINLRTGKKVEGTAWAISLTVKPEWTQMINARRELNNVRSIGAVPSQKVLKAAYSDAVIDAEIVQQATGNMPNEFGISSLQPVANEAVRKPECIQAVRRPLPSAVVSSEYLTNPVSLVDIVSSACADDSYLEIEPEASWQPSEQDLEALREIFRTYKWKKKAIIALLERYNKTPATIKSCSQQQWKEIINAAKSTYAKQYCS